MSSGGKGGRPLSVEIGDRYGRLLIEGFQREKKPNGKSQVRCLCKCDCGGQAAVVVHHLKDGSTKSCGCVFEERRNHKHPSWKGFGEIPGSYWSSLKYGALRRGIKFDISIEQAWVLYLGQGGRCALTGDPIVFSKNWKERGTASLDRLDSIDSYRLGNVQWVEKSVNEFKMAMPNAQFIEICVKIAKFAGMNST
jgi:hypothetical protein